MELYRYYPGLYPVVVNVPHAGTQIPPHLKSRFTDTAAHLPDTDWYVDRLYNFTRDMGIHLLVAANSRYVVDLNRNREEEVLYPGCFNTSVLPMQTFTKEPIYREGREPSTRESQERISAYWQPYHNKLLRILRFCIERYGKVVLFDAHSIKSEVPSLFDGQLPALNIGTAGGNSANTELTDKVFHLCQSSSYSSTLNGRFKGGYITRTYGKPAAGCHVIQLEMTQQCYMSETAPYDYSHEKAADMQRQVLHPLMETLIDWAQQ